MWGLFSSFVPMSVSVKKQKNIFFMNNYCFFYPKIKRIFVVAKTTIENK